MSKRFPKIKSKKEAEKLFDDDLADYINKDNFKSVTFEFAPKDKTISLRLSEKLLRAIKKAAKWKGINYQKYIREALEKSLDKEIA